MNNFINKLILVGILTYSIMVYAGDGPGAFDEPTSPIDSYLPMLGIIGVLLIVMFRKRIVAAFK